MVPNLCFHAPQVNASVFERVESLLTRHGIRFDVLRHAPVYTSEEAAAVRGVPLASGAKALICKVESRFVMLVIPADRKLDSKRVRQALAIRALRFASADELRTLTGLAPGAIPPFGSLFGVPAYCDANLANQERINFNAGDHAVSVSMRCADYLAVEQPTIGCFTA